MSEQRSVCHLRADFRFPAKTAARTAHAFNPSVKITPIHANIKDAEFDVTWYRNFDIVLNALDNLGEQYFHMFDC